MTDSRIITDKDYCDRAVITAVPCATCAAQRGWPCFSRTGRPCRVHQARVAAWRETQPDRPAPRRYKVIDGEYIACAD